jgi:putative oxidoreductase
MCEQALSRDSRSALTDWLLPGAIAVAFAMFGAEKFTDSNHQWLKLFGQIGFGQWFRYFTGAVEMLGGALVLIPWTVTAGLAALSGTMASASLIWVFVLGQPANAIITGTFCVALTLFWLNRRGS